jgi:sortase A
MTSVESAPPAPQRSPRGPAVLAAVGRFLITAGVVVLLFVGFQLWGTGLQEARAQDALRDEFDHTLAEAQARLGTPAATDEPGAHDTPDSAPVDSTVPPVTLPGGIDPEVVAYFFPEDGDAVARIEMPTIGVDKIVVNGVQVADLRKGPGHYPGTALVGAAGNSSIAGHRTTYGAPFNRIDELAPGDEIHVTGILGRFTYRILEAEEAFASQLDAVDDVHSVEGGHVIVAPSATWVLGDFGDNRLTLTACHPKLSSRQRIIVAAELVEAPAEVPAFDPALVADLTDEAGASALADETFDDEAFDDEVLDDRADGIGAGAGSAPSETLDEGLDGDRAAIPGAVAWLVAASTIWIVAGIIGRRWFADRGHRFAVRLGGLVPAAICLWFSFEMIDRALPAG